MPKKQCMKAIAPAVAFGCTGRRTDRPGECRRRIQRSRSSWEERFLALVDILEFKKIVERMAEDPRFYRTVHNILKSLDRQAEKFSEEKRATARSIRATRKRGRMPLIFPARLEMVAFSDTYIISDTDLLPVLDAVERISSSLLAESILSRGAVVYGSVYHKGRVVFGPAVNRAHELESLTAVYPRILIDDAVRGEGWFDHEHRRQGRLFLQDKNDGCWFLNLLAPPFPRRELSQFLAKKEYSVFLRRVSESLNREIELAGGRLPELSKLRWAQTQLNENLVFASSV